MKKPSIRYCCRWSSAGGRLGSLLSPLTLLLLVLSSSLSGCGTGGGRLSARDAALRGMSAKQLAARDSVFRELESYYEVLSDSFRSGSVQTIVPRNRPPREEAHMWAYFLLDDSIARGFQVVFQVPEAGAIPSAVMLEFKVGQRLSNIILQKYMLHEFQHFYAVPSAYAVSFLDSLSEAEVSMRVTNWERNSIVHYPADEAASVLRVWRDYRALGGNLDSPDLTLKKD